MGHLNCFLAPRGGNLNKPILTSSNARGGMLNFRIDRRIRTCCDGTVGRSVSSKCYFNPNWVVMLNFVAAFDT